MSAYFGTYLEVFRTLVRLPVLCLLELGISDSALLKYPGRYAPALSQLLVFLLWPNFVHIKYITLPRKYTLF